MSHTQMFSWYIIISSSLLAVLDELDFPQSPYDSRMGQVVVHAPSDSNEILVKS